MRRPESGSRSSAPTDPSVDLLRHAQAATCECMSVRVVTRTYSLHRRRTRFPLKVRAEAGRGPARRIAQEIGAFTKRLISSRSPNWRGRGIGSNVGCQKRKAARKYCLWRPLGTLGPGFPRLPLTEALTESAMSKPKTPTFRSTICAPSMPWAT
jgi:hypothetical protein